MDPTQSNMMEKLSITTPGMNPTPKASGSGTSSGSKAASSQSPAAGGGMVSSPGCSSGAPSSVQPSTNYPPLSGSKHLCTICGDRASGKHYGVFSCEGCKGFFKRTVRKEITFVCKEKQDCDVDKLNRNRCQYCRYMKCLKSGMRREAVQEERQPTNGRDSKDGKGGKDGKGDKVESSTDEPDYTLDYYDKGAMILSVEKITKSETFCEEVIQEAKKSSNNVEDSKNKSKSGSSRPSKDKHFKNFVGDLEKFENREHLLKLIVDWALKIPFFSDLELDTRVILLKSGWNELLISEFAFHSTKLENTFLGADGQPITRDNSHAAGVGEIFDRVLVELVGKMRDMKMDKTELGYLRTIVLFDPNACDLLDKTQAGRVEILRDVVYIALENYVKRKSPSEPGRFAKLLIRLPALRSIGLKCNGRLFFYKLLRDENNSCYSFDDDAINEVHALETDPNARKAYNSLGVIIQGRIMAAEKR